jgi:multidrug resistance efflux pump
MRSNWFYVLIGLLLVTMLWMSQRFFSGSANSSVGIAYSKEYKINVEKPSQVKRVAVVPGQLVKAGDLLIELTSPTLDVDIDKMNNRIITLKSEREEKAKLAKSEVAYVKAELGVKIEEITTEIIQKENELALNQNLTKEFASDKKESVQNPLQQTIASLKQQRLQQEEAMNIRVKDIFLKSETDQLVLMHQIELLERELDVLREERKGLVKYAVNQGVVGNIYVKETEQVEAYASLLSVNPAHPTSVVAYIVGRKNQFVVGAAVEVRSYEDKQMTVPGKVIGYGSIVPLPEILQKSTAVKAFGREVFIEIAPDNFFASGERVLIR